MTAEDVSSCPVTRGEVDLDFYAQRDGEWRELGLAAPARRALVNAELLTLSSLRRVTRSDVAALHGMGPTAVARLDAALASRGWTFTS